MNEYLAVEELCNLLLCNNCSVVECFPEILCWHSI